MLPQDVAVEAARVDAQLLGHDEAETGRVQVGAAADDAVLGKAAEFPRHVGHDVHCVGVKTDSFTRSVFKDETNLSDILSRITDFSSEWRHHVVTTCVTQY